MKTKEQIEKLLISLKNKGIDRRSIEKDLDYREFYIDQLLSKGGNVKFLKRLEKYNIERTNENGQKPDNVLPLYSLTELKRKIEEQWQVIMSQQETILINAKRAAPDINDNAKNG